MSFDKIENNCLKVPDHIAWMDRAKLGMSYFHGGDGTEVVEFVTGDKNDWNAQLFFEYRLSNRLLISDDKSRVTQTRQSVISAATLYESKVGVRVSRTTNRKIK